MQQKNREEKRGVTGIAHIYSTYNNTIIHITDLANNTIAQVSGGKVTKHSRLKATPTVAMFAAKRAAEAGVESGKIIIDPGIGFGKTVEHNLEILKSLKTLKSIGYPILIGLSRKSFIGHILQADLSQRLEGGLAAAAIAILNGASILRVHDVKEFSKATRMADAIKNNRL